jgi:hypothetical protein
MNEEMYDFARIRVECPAHSLSITADVIPESTLTVNPYDAAAMCSVRGLFLVKYEGRPHGGMHTYHVVVEPGIEPTSALEAVRTLLEDGYDNAFGEKLVR